MDFKRLSMRYKKLSLHQLIMHLAPSLRKPKYNSLKKWNFCLFLHTESWWISSTAPADSMSTLQKEALGKSEKPSQPYLSLIIIKTKLFQNHPIIAGTDSSPCFKGGLESLEWCCHNWVRPIMLIAWLWTYHWLTQL